LFGKTIFHPMPQPPVNLDRRAQRSRELILEALFALMLERGYERLTIQNLIDRAGVGRATFYAHFQSKDELLAASIGRLHAWLAQAGRARDEPLGFTLPFFQHLASHRRIYEMTVARESESSVERHVKQMLTDLVRQDLRRCHGPIAAPRLDLATHYVVGALWSSFIWWMESDKPLPPEDLNSQFQRLCFPGLDVAVAA
jgi:AcrR family transcriptional regulator